MHRRLIGSEPKNQPRADIVAGLPVAASPEQLVGSIGYAMLKLHIQYALAGLVQECVLAVGVVVVGLYTQVLSAFQPSR
ncbi:hypothetical protein D3C80_1839140 [compost metagenome]